MNILITGAGGFIGRSCYDFFKHRYITYNPTHSELDLFDLETLKHFIKQKQIDCVIHTAAKISRIHTPMTPTDVYTSLRLFENIVYAAQDCRLLFNFGAAAELGHYLVDDIYCAKESDIDNGVTPEYGGFVKRIITKRLLQIENPRCYNLRIAGCFGEYEKSDRFIKANLLRAIDSQPLIIHQDKYMDFIYVNDLCRIIEFLLHHQSHRDLNCVYTDKLLLSEIAQIIINITGSTSPIQVNQPGLGTVYTLDPYLLNTLHIPMVGITQGIQEVYDKYNYTSI